MYYSDKIKIEKPDLHPINDIQSVNSGKSSFKDKKAVTKSYQQFSDYKNKKQTKKV